MLNLLEVPLEIPTLMKNADDLDSLAGVPEEDEVRSDGQTEIALPDMIDLPALPRSRRKGLEG